MATDVPSFELEIRIEGERTRYVPRGELDLATAPELEGRVLGTIREGGSVVLDLSELTFMDSTGVRTVVAAHQAARDAGTELAVVRPPRESPVSRVIDISGIAGTLGLVDDA